MWQECHSSRDGLTLYTGTAACLAQATFSMNNTFSSNSADYSRYGTFAHPLNGAHDHAK